jgi:Fe(3+) dicitrate transport protein
VRYHQDEEDRFQNDDRYQMVGGTMVGTSVGAPGSQDNRIGEAEAWAFYVRDTIGWNELTISPGVRYETIDLTRTVYSTSDPGRDGPAIVDRSTVDVWLPGIGATYAIDDNVNLVAGVHRGFVNPAPGSDAEAEDSWNYEAGIRYGRGAGSVEAIAFFVDYQNLVGTCTASTGGDCNIGDQYDGGKAAVHGLELAAAWDAGELLANDWSVPLSAVYTWTDGEFESSFNSSFAEWGNVTEGDELPLVPEHQLTLNAGLEFECWQFYLTVNYVDEARSVAGTGPIPADERVDSRTLLDLSGEFDVGRGASIFASVTNLADEAYNVAFRPAGARPGAPRSWLAGMKLRF